MKIEISQFFLLIVFFFVCCSEETDYENILDSQVRESAILNRGVMQGRHVFKDGTIYEGELAHGKPNGFGTRELVNGDLYEGQHKNGFGHGHGTMRYKSDSKLISYIGNWKSGKRDGYGTLILKALATKLLIVIS